MPQPNMRSLFLVPFLCSFVTTGCARTVSPDSAIDAAKTALGEATRVEAGKYAPGELDKAQAKFNRAEEEARSHHEVLARRFAEQASVDARYSQVRAQAEKAQAAATENRDTKETIQGIH